MGYSFLIAGLGNPGSKYAKTRHNIGFMIVDEWANRHQAVWKSSPWQSLTCEIKLGSLNCILIKPQTFMNLSGQSVQPAMSHYKPDHLLVLHDEIDLEFGDIRYKFGGGHRGHNGLRDIKARLGEYDFGRIRFGVGRPQNEHLSVADYVLGRFLPEESSALVKSIDDAISIIEKLILQQENI